MTGKDLIEFIQANNAEDLEIMLVDTDSSWMLGRLKTEKISIEDSCSGKHLLIR